MCSCCTSDRDAITTIVVVENTTAPTRREPAQTQKVVVAFGHRADCGPSHRDHHRRCGLEPERTGLEGFAASSCSTSTAGCVHVPRQAISQATLMARTRKA